MEANFFKSLEMVLKHEGAVFLSGAAPRGPLERELGTLVGPPKELKE